jgi:hypothetical protein
MHVLGDVLQVEFAAHQSRSKEREVVDNVGSIGERIFLMFS